jgi:hypothetical protein
MILDEVNDVLRKLIREELGFKMNQVFPANRNQPTGTLPFITVLITSIGSEGWDDVKIKDQGFFVIETATGVRRLSVSVQFFRGDAQTLANKLRTRFQMTSAIQKLRKLGLGLVSFSPVKDLSAVNNTKWEPRAQILMELYIVAKETDKIDTYGEFPLRVSTENTEQVGIIYEP